MANNLVPDSDHISRFARGKEVAPDGRITGAAFELRKRDRVDGEYGMSVNWLEYLQLPDREAEIDEVRRVYKEKRLPIDEKSKIGVLMVGYMRDFVLNNSDDNREIVVEHKDDQNDPSHARIIGGLKMDDELIFELLAEAVQNDYPVLSAP